MSKAPLPPPFGPINTEVLSIRPVINGWIVHTVAGPEMANMVTDTLVFNDIDALCDAIKTIYTETENESS